MAAPKVDPPDVQTTTRAYQLKGEGAQNAYLRPFGRGYCRDAHSTSRRTASRVMQLTAGQRCAAVGFIKQLYLDRPFGVTGWEYGLLTRKAARECLPLCWDRCRCFWQLAEKCLLPPAYIGFLMLIIISIISSLCAVHFVARLFRDDRNLRASVNHAYSPSSPSSNPTLDIFIRRGCQ